MSPSGGTSPPSEGASIATRQSPQHNLTGGDMRRFNCFPLCAIAALLAFSMGPAAALPREAPVGTGPGGNALLPDGFYITPTVAPGSNFQRLSTGLRSDGSADAEGAVTTALSPDGTALLIVTTGYNTNFNFQATGSPTPIVHPVLDPTTGQPTSTTDRRAEWVFIYDVRSGTPVQKQRLNLPSTYDGLVWDPSGARFYVSAGIDDRVYVYKATGTGTASADRTYVADAPFILLGHDSHQTSPIPTYDGGIFKNTAVNGPIGQAMFIPFTAAAAGLAISNDGKRLFVANLMNDSLSIADTSTRQVTREVKFFTPGQSTAIGEYPFWAAVLSGASGNPVKTYVSSLRDGQVLVVTPSSGLAKVIHVGGEPNRILLTADQKQLYVANGDLDEIEVIDTTSDSVVRRISLARSGYPYRGSWPNSLALSPDGRTLYVTLGGENAVAVIDVMSRSLLGR